MKQSKLLRILELPHRRGALGYRFTIIFLGMLLSVSSFGLVFDGQVRQGLWKKDFDGKGQFRQDQLDNLFLSTHFHLNLRQFFSKDQTFTFRIDFQRCRLDQKPHNDHHCRTNNRIKIREIVYRKSYSNEPSYYFSLGRFALQEANLYSLDGFEFGFRLNAEHRIGSFAGYLMDDDQFENVRGNDHSQELQEQFGFYWVYDQSRLADYEIYMVNSIGKSPHFKGEDFDNNFYLYHLSVINFNFKHFFNTQLLFDENLNQSHFRYQYYGQDSRLLLGLSRVLVKIDKNWYFLGSQEQWSKLDQFSFALDHDIGNNWQFELDTSFQHRSLDSFDSREISIGSRYRGLIKENIAILGVFGSRFDDEADENFFNLELSAYQNDFSILLSHEIARRQEHDSEDYLNYSRSFAELAFYLNGGLSGSAAYQFENNPYGAAHSFFFIVAYQFGQKVRVPRPEHPPTFRAT